jgi:hypothetical protein
MFVGVMVVVGGAFARSGRSPGKYGTASRERLLK